MDCSSTELKLYRKFYKIICPSFLTVTLATENFKKRMGYWLVTFCSIYMTFTCVDKPHNTYLKIWINQGLPILLSFLVLCTIYLLHALKFYTLSKGLGIGFTLAIVHYLGARFFSGASRC